MTTWNRRETIHWTRRCRSNPCFNVMLNNVVNGALKGVKKQTQEAMAKMMQGSDMGGILGG